MRYKPHDYQEYATRFILEHPVAAVILQMGLGKTAATLDAIDKLIYESFEVHKVLVIAPLRVAKVTWSDEIKKWENFSHLRYSVAVGTEKERIAALNAEADIYIINRENVQWLVEKSKVPFEFDMVVIDELSSFKNWKSQRVKALMAVRLKVKRIVGLTGTPSSNGLMDLFSEYRCLDMGERLGRFIGEYRNRYFTPDKRNAQMVFTYKPLPGAEEKIYEKISDITISMKSLDHLDMPDLIETEYLVEMNKKEKKMYEELEEDLVLSIRDEDITVANAAAFTNKLVQMANGCVYSDCKAEIKIHDRKLDALEDILESANAKPILVAYWFKHDLKRIKDRFPEAVELKDPKSFNAWNEGKITLGLIHPASAGHGLNLQSGGNVIVWFGLTWSLELYQQTNSRLWRQGQKNDTVSVIHIMTKDTVDEKIVRALIEKDDIQAKLIDAVKAIVSAR